MKSKSDVSVVQRIVAALANSRFMWLIMGLFLLQALWLALSGRYPMAFDEDFHLGVIRLYAHHPNPFWTIAPSDSGQFGAISRDPSYLYHYLMSFPYRLISLFTGDQTIQVLILRFINIAFFASGLVLFRRLLLRTGASRAIVHACLLLFVFIPIVPLLAAQINYDNLLLPVVALVLIVADRVSSQLAKQKQFSLLDLGFLLSLGLLGCLVKYAFLPILMTISIFIIVRLWQTYHSWRAFGHALRRSFTKLTATGRLGLLAILLLSSLLFMQRYGVNVVRYHTPIPSCDKVLSVKACSSYGPWYRDYIYSQHKLPGSHSPLTYASDWIYGMWLRTFFSVGGPGTDFETRGPLLLPALFGILVSAVSLLLIAMYGKRVFRKYNSKLLWLFVSMAAVYASVLWLDGYRAFLTTAQPVAINGRYLLPVLLPVSLIAGLCWSEWLGKRSNYKVAAVSIMVLSLIWGGGALTFVLRSNANWYWPNKYVVNVNKAIRDTTGPVVPGYYRPTEFLR